MTEHCRDCNGIEMIRIDATHYKCPECGRGKWVISTSVKELKQLGMQAYLDGRHLNRGGGLNL